MRETSLILIMGVKKAFRIQMKTVTFAAKIDWTFHFVQLLDQQPQTAGFRIKYDIILHMPNFGVRRA